MKYLKYEYTCLYLLISKAEGASTQDFQEKLKNLDVRNHPKLMTLYIHGCFLPYLAEQRDSCRLRIATKVITIDGLLCEYTGEVDTSNKACGEGKAIIQKNGSMYEGTFLDDTPHGIRK